MDQEAKDHLGPGSQGTLWNLELGLEHLEPGGFWGLAVKVLEEQNGAAERKLVDPEDMEPGSQGPSGPGSPDHLDLEEDYGPGGLDLAGQGPWRSSAAAAQIWARGDMDQEPRGPLGPGRKGNPLDLGGYGPGGIWTWRVLDLAVPKGGGEQAQTAAAQQKWAWRICEKGNQKGIGEPGKPRTIWTGGSGAAAAASAASGPLGDMDPEVKDHWTWKTKEPSWAWKPKGQNWTWGGYGPGASGPGGYGAWQSQGPGGENAQQLLK
ncbi:hypothetical protein HNY73_014701 [Argiope bruennichi]|uniref:Uncharacterized protein n=1 Tax=Argiope bruennichi TaxID=94029 RepID=A0A8T0ERD6_ARGBR|nr:hypothetical protein HNY73_014701 [Argiope bruennichi]